MTPDSKGRRIIGLLAENIKKIVAVEIKPDGNMVMITGKNEAGKSSLLDSIWWAIGGLAAIQKVPIREGQNEAKIRLDLGDVIITRKFKRKDETQFATSVSVENADGSRFSSPQTMLDGLMSALCLNPLEFIGMKSEEQFNVCRQFVPNVDFDAVDKANDEDFDTRAAINKRLKEAIAGADAIKISATPPCEAIDVDTLEMQFDTAGIQNTERVTRQANRDNANSRIQELRARIDTLPTRVTAVTQARINDFDEAARIAGERIFDCEQQIRALQERISQVRTKLSLDEEDCRLAIGQDTRQLTAEADEQRTEADALQEKLDKAGPLPDSIDTTGLRAQIISARESNQRLTQWNTDNSRREEQRKLAVTLKSESDALTKVMQKRTKEKDDAIAAAKMPVEGLSFGNKVVLLNGLPLEQASRGVQIRTSFMIAVASARNLRVVRITEGERLDSTNLQIIADLAEQHDMQVWMEKMDESGKIGFVIEDGHLKGQE